MNGGLNKSRRLYHRFFIGILCSVFIAYSALSVVRHSHYETGAYDLGIFDQTVWHYSRFMVPYNTIKERLIFGDHLNLTLPLVSSLYWIWSDVRMLLVFQSMWIVVSAYGIYRIGLRRGMSAFVGIGVAVLYVLFYGFQQAVIFDFHASIIGVGCLVWTAYFFEAKQYRRMWIFVALLLLTQENMGIALAGLGCMYMHSTKKRFIPTAWIVLGIVYTIVATRIVAWVSPVGFEYAPLLPRSFSAYITQFFDSPDKIQVWLRSFGWFAFVPLFSPGTVVAVFLDLSQYFLTGPNFVRNWTTLTHHRAMLAPFLVLGTFDVLMYLKQSVVRSWIVVGMVLSVFVLQYMWHMPLNKLVKPQFWRQEQWMLDTDTLIRYVPLHGVVAAQHNIVPHISQRKDIYLVWPRAHVASDPRCAPIRRNDSRDCWWLDFPNTVQYLVVDTRPYQWVTQILETDDHVQEAVKNMEMRKAITPMQSIGTVRLYSVDATVVVKK